MSRSAPRAQGYSTREVARALGLSSTQVRSFVRDGLLHPTRGPRGAFRFGFRDLLLLRNARGLLSARIPGHRVHRVMRSLRHQMNDRSLSTVRLSVNGRRIVARREGEVWEPETGQRCLDFVAPMARRQRNRKAVPFIRPSGPSSTEIEADQRYLEALVLEEKDPEAALEALLEAAELDPRHANAHLDLGRLLHESGDPESAETHYRRTLALRPGDPVAAYNLGVALEEQERKAEAIEAYRLVVENDPSCAEAHHHLFELLQTRGDELGARRHLKAYRTLVGQINRKW